MAVLYDEYVDIPPFSDSMLQSETCMVCENQKGFVHHSDREWETGLSSKSMGITRGERGKERQLVTDFQNRLSTLPVLYCVCLVAYIRELPNRSYLHPHALDFMIVCDPTKDPACKS